MARSYDNVGNTTAIGGIAKEFVYSDANRMSAVRLNGVTAMSYAYNGKGEQVRRNNAGTDVVTVYDEEGHWLGEYDNAGVPNQQVVWLDDMPVGLIVGAAAANQPLHYIEADALGTPRAVIESQRNVAVWSWPLSEEAFGSSEPIDDADGDGMGLSFNLRFPGQRYDAATQLNYNYFRDYEPESGRYVESDPIGLGGGVTTYGYANLNGLINTDPTGEAVPLVAGACAAGGCEVLAGATATALAYLGLPPEIREVLGVATLPGLLQYAQRRYEESNIALMASPGRQVDTQIVNDYGADASASRLKGCPPPDRCEWLKENAHLYSPDAVKKTAKAWGCKGSRWSKGGKARN